MTELSKMLKQQARDPRPLRDQPSQNNKREATTSRDAETFNLIARSLLNVSDQIPNLVRDAADLKTDNAEIKNLIWQIANSIAGLKTDIERIAHAVSVPLTLQNPPGKMKLRAAGGAPSDESLREALRSIPGVNENGDR
jgi:hypothetical protein